MTEIFLRFIPESVRWLLARQKNDKAGEIVRKAARVNRVVLSERVLAGFESGKTEHREVSLCVQYGQRVRRVMGCMWRCTSVQRPSWHCRACLSGQSPICGAIFIAGKSSKIFSSSFVLDAQTDRQTAEQVDGGTDGRSDLITLSAGVSTCLKVNKFYGQNIMLQSTNFCISLDCSSQYYAVDISVTGYNENVASVCSISAWWSKQNGRKTYARNTGDNLPNLQDQEVAVAFCKLIL
jgi:hypothetical protein